MGKLPISKPSRKGRGKPSRLSGEEKARICARLADFKKGEDITILDLRRVTYVTEFFVIITGTNPRQLQAIARSIEEEMTLRGAKKPGLEGAGAESRWILLDYGDVVVHVFADEWRKLYDLELLWGDMPRLAWAGE
ncbi:MAG: ribosome silencing factor [Alphaproteobacteria bacterium]